MADAVVDSKALISELVKFYATPAAYREDRTLSSLAHRLRVSEAVLLGHLALIPGAAGKILQSVALSAAEGAPKVMAKMQEKAEAGDVRAAQVYLDFFRMTITDQNLIEAAQGQVKPVGAMVEEVAKSAGKLLELAQSLGGSEEEARVRMLGPGGLAIEAQVVRKAKEGPLDLRSLRLEQQPYPDGLAESAVVFAEGRNEVGEARARICQDGHEEHGRTEVEAGDSLPIEE